MKKTALVLVLLLAILPAMAFAEFQVGLVGAYKPSFDTGMNASSLKSSLSTLSVDQFELGLEMRSRFLGIFQFTTSIIPVSGMGYYGDQTYLDIAPTAGLTLQLLFLRAGVSVGPDLWIPLGSDSSSGDIFDGINLKASGELILGPVCLGLQALYFLSNNDYYGRSYSEQLKEMISSKTLPWLGLTAMVKF